MIFSVVLKTPILREKDEEDEEDEEDEDEDEKEKNSDWRCDRCHKKLYLWDFNHESECEMRRYVFLPHRTP